MADQDAPPPPISDAQARLEAELTLPEAVEAAPVTPEPAPVEPPVAQDPPSGAEVPPITPETPPVAPVDEEDPDELPLPDKSKQIRLKGEAFQFARLVKNGLDPAEAYAKAYGKAPAAAPAATDTPPAPAAPEPTAAEKRLEEVKAELAKFAKEESFYTEDVDKLQAERAELMADIKVQKAIATARAEERAELEAEQARQREVQEKGNAFDKALDASFAKVVERYGDAGKEDGALGAAILDHILKISEDPDHALQAVAKAGNLLPQHVMHEVADTLGLAASTQSPKPAATPATKVPAMLPAPGSARQTPVVQANEAQRKAALSTNLANARTPEEKARILSAELGGEEEVTDGKFAMA